MTTSRTEQRSVGTELTQIVALPYSSDKVSAHGPHTPDPSPNHRRGRPRPIAPPWLPPRQLNGLTRHAQEARPLSPLVSRSLDFVLAKPGPASCVQPTYRFGPNTCPARIKAGVVSTGPVPAASSALAVCTRCGMREARPGRKAAPRIHREAPLCCPPEVSQAPWPRPTGPRPAAAAAAQVCRGPRRCC